MPQDVPVEASETLVFIPECFKTIENAPSFVLRACTSRVERFIKRLGREEGLQQHSLEAIRAEMLAGLKANWSPEAYEQHLPIITEYWQANDQHALQLADDPSLKFEYDEEIVAAITELLALVEARWHPLRRMYADNAEFRELTITLMVTAMLKDWSNLPGAVRQVADGYVSEGFITIDSAESVKRALNKLSKKHGIPEEAAWAELFLACTRRMRLDEEEAGNSASPSPSNESPEPSSTAPKRGKSGKSLASASSTKTPATA